MSCTSGVSLAAGAAACVDSVVVAALTNEDQVGETKVQGKCYSGWCQTCPECACFEQERKSAAELIGDTTSRTCIGGRCGRFLGCHLPKRFAISPNSHIMRKFMDRPSALLAL